MKEVSKQLKNLGIPYPQKLLLESELAEHFLRIPSEEENKFSASELNELSQTHNNILYKLLNQLDPKLKHKIEYLTLGMLMVAFLNFLNKEDFMMNFIYEGGAPMYPILILSSILLFRELMLFFRTVVIKDHSNKNLKIDTNSVFLGSLALLASGIGTSALGVYFTANGVASHKLSNEIFLFGLKESLGGIILSCTAASLVLILHFTTRRILLSWKAPLSAEEV
jgi:hypothetical protein